MKISSGCFSGVQKAPFVTGLQLCFSSFSSFSTIGCLLPAHPVLAWGPRDSEPAWGSLPHGTHSLGEARVCTWESREQ